MENHLESGIEWEKSMALAEEMVTDAILQKRFGWLSKKIGAVIITAVIKSFRKVNSVEDLMVELNLEMNAKPTKRPADEAIETKSAKCAKMTMEAEDDEFDDAISTESELAFEVNALKRRSKDADTIESKKIKLN